MRKYELIRAILLKVSHDCAGFSNGLGLCEMEDLIKGSFYSIEDLKIEIKRLIREDLIDGEIKYSDFGTLEQAKITGITTEGKEFLRLIEEPRVWEICIKTLQDAGVDLSYPFLKEVCEEIVKRYVFSKIPIKKED